MERKHFLKSLFAGAITAPALLTACGKDDVTPASSSTTTTTTTGGTTTTSSGSCTVIPTETEGPYPTHTPSSYVRSDIREDRTGYALTVKINVTNTAASCAALSGALVDIWHCDKDGNYSEYVSGLTNVHFLRGRQTTDANGQVTFTSIFPGWYQGRATHIHVHIFTSSGTSLKITQIAFPEGTGSAVLAVNGYSKGLTGYTYYTKDNIFNDDSTGSEIATVTGTTTDGFVLTITLPVAA